MALYVNTNVSSMISQRYLTKNTANLATSLERLSSGSRINHAGDDAAGLALSEGLRSQIRGTQQSIENIQDGVNMLQIAEGGLEIIGESLQRIRELTVQSANATYATAERQSMLNEIHQRIEEISRINGFDKITPTLPNKSNPAEISTAERVISRINNLMLGCGLNEMQTSSLIGEPLLKQFGIAYDKENAIFVENPASEEFAMLRQTLAASLLSCMKYNFDNGQKDFWGYEIGRTYLRTAETTEKNSGVKETQVLAGIITGNIQNSHWQSTGEIDFYTVKGIVDKVLEEFGLTRRIKVALLADSPLANSHGALHPYKTAVLTMLGKQPTIIGYYGEIHPELRGKLKLNQDAFLFKLDLDMVIEAVNENVVKYKKLPQFPEVQRDLAVFIPKTTSWDDLEKVIKKGIDNKIFNGCEVFDVYEGEHVQEGFKSVAFRVRMQDANATMTDDVIETQMANLRSVLKKNIPDLTLRGE